MLQYATNKQKFKTICTLNCVRQYVSNLLLQEAPQRRTMIDYNVKQKRRKIEAEWTPKQ